MHCNVLVTIFVYLLFIVHLRVHVLSRMLNLIEAVISAYLQTLFSTEIILVFDSMFQHPTLLIIKSLLNIKYFYY